MNTWGVILTIYAIVAVGITIVMYFRSRKPLTPLEEFIETKRKPLWQILLPLPIYPIAFVFYVLIQILDPKERKKRAARKYLKTDKDIRKEYAKLETDKIDIKEGLDDTQEKAAAICLGNALLNEDLSSFNELLAENAGQYIYEEKRFDSINGRSAIRKYWQDWIVRQKEQGFTHKFKIIRAEYFSTEALAIDYYNSSKRYCTGYLVVFHFNAQAQLQRIIFASSHIYYTYFVEDKKDLLVTLETLFPDAPNDELYPGYLENKFNASGHLPCINCGKPSSQLLWYGYRRIAYAGKVSFCPDCKEIVEHYCDTHIYVDYSTEHFPISDNIDYIEKRIAEGSAEGFVEHGKPIGWQKYIYFFDDSVLNMNQPKEWSTEEKVKYAIDNGRLDAYNNLALCYVETDKEKAVEYFKKAIEHNDEYAMLNLSLFYYKHNDIPHFIEYTRLAAQAKDVIAMYNLAFVMQSDEYDINDVNGAIEQYKNTIEECLSIEYDDFKNEEEKQIVEVWDNTVLSRSYYDLATIYLKRGDFKDLLQAYAYLNQYPGQDEMIQNQKTFIYEKMLDRHTTYDDLPF